jgi:hypothetical protein
VLFSTMDDNSSSPLSNDENDQPADKLCGFFDNELDKFVYNEKEMNEICGFRKLYECPTHDIFNKATCLT